MPAVKAFFANSEECTHLLARDWNKHANIRSAVHESVSADYLWLMPHYDQYHLSKSLIAGGNVL